MVAEIRQIAGRIWVQAVLQQIGDYLTLRPQGTRRQIHLLIQFLIELRLVLRLICNPRQIDRNHADRSRMFPISEETACFAAQLM